MSDPTHGDPARRPRALARRQAGAFSRAQALGVGFTEHMVRHRIATGEWLVLGTGIYAVASHEHSWRQRYTAALLAQPGGVLRGTTGAHVYALDGFTATEEVNLSVPPTAHARRELAVPRRSSLIRPRLVDGFRTNALPVVMLEIAADAPGRLQQAYESAILRRRTTFERVAEVAATASAGRLRGARDLRDLLRRLGDGHVPPESELERLLFLLLEAAGITGFVRQAPIPWATGHQRVDVYIPRWRMIIEVDGRLWHARVDSFERDRARDREALAHGVVVVRFAWPAVRHDPARCAEQVVAIASGFGHLCA